MASPTVNKTPEETMATIVFASPAMIIAQTSDQALHQKKMSIAVLGIATSHVNTDLSSTNPFSFRSSGVMVCLVSSFLASQTKNGICARHMTITVNAAIPPWRSTKPWQ